ncbi:uncharacterized protein EAE97_005275 [Botrytis byssoidea]|uniref:Uncharacterized protein n=1 Tax=Botrytis byssoidea TaxID=139641 RepID=A0A9P5M6Y5_9HELO|nr:uncharacterized protein EAE97_005275 [Botrytis byssoidea]KAF7944642.1 hypothetical protein EAE97_005275 [Botrytis byssoidea]
MSLSKPSIPVQRCPANCRGCATFAAFGGGYFPPQTPGGALYPCYEYALALGIIEGPSSRTIENEDLIPAPLTIPAKSARRPPRKPIAPSAFTSPPPLLPFPMEVNKETRKKMEAIAAGPYTFEEKVELMTFEATQDPQSAAYMVNYARTHQSDASAGSAMSQIERDAMFSSPLSSIGVYEEKNATYPLGHSYLPPGVIPLPSDLLFTITTCGERCATSFVGMYAMRMRDAFQASGVDMRAHEVRGEWEKTGAKRWLYSLGMDKDKEKVNKILRKGKDVVVAQEKRGVSTFKLLREYENLRKDMESEIENAFRDIEKAVEDSQEAEGGAESSEPHSLPDKIVRRAVEKVVRQHFDPIDWQGPDRNWLGADASIATLPPRQRPLQSCGINGLVSDDPNDESACTSFVRLKRTKPMDFKWYHRSNEFEKPKYEWPQQVRCIVSNGTIRERSMGPFYDEISDRLSMLKEHSIKQNIAAENTLHFVNSSWQFMAKGMNICGWYWDEQKRILIKGYSVQDDYKKDCDRIDRELDNWKAIIKEGMETPIKTGDLSKKALRYTTIGEHLLRQWKEGPGIMVTKTPSDEKMEGSLLAPHTTDNASHINYLNARIADATRHRAEIESKWNHETAPQDVFQARRDLLAHIDVLEDLKIEIEALNRQEETGQSPIFKDKKTRRELNLWERERSEEMRLWERKPAGENNGQSSGARAK